MKKFPQEVWQKVDTAGADVLVIGDAFRLFIGKAVPTDSDVGMLMRQDEIPADSPAYVYVLGEGVVHGSRMDGGEPF